MTVAIRSLLARGALPAWQHRDTQVLSWLCGGLLLRLVLMPFFAHSDLLSLYWRAYQLAEHGRLPATNLQSLVHYFHALVIIVLSPVLPSETSLWPTAPAAGSFSGSEWLLFVSQPNVFRDLFLWKLPYLGLDIAVAVVLLRLDARGRVGTAPFRLWMVYPFALFTSYIFGRHDVVSVFFVLIALYLLAEKRLMWAMAALGVAVAFRYYALLFVPFFVLTGRRSLLERAVATAVTMVPLALVELVAAAGGRPAELASLPTWRHSAFLLEARLALDGRDVLFLFPLLYALLVLYCLFRPSDTYLAVSRLCGATVLLLLSTSTFHPQYALWLAPFVVLEADAEPRVWALTAVQALGFVVYTFDLGRPLAGYLAGAVAPEFFWGLPGPLETLAGWAYADALPGLGHTLFAAASLTLAYLMLVRVHRDTARAVTS